MEFVTHPPSNAAHRLLSGFASALVVVLLAACDGSLDADNPSNQPSLRLSFQPVKTFHFEWDAVAGAERYQLLENPDGQSGFDDSAPVIEVPASQLSANLEVPLYNRLKASYLLRSCAGNNCETVAQVAVSKPEALTPAIGELRLDIPLRLVSSARPWHSVAMAIPWLLGLVVRKASLARSICTPSKRMASGKQSRNG